MTDKDNKANKHYDRKPKILRNKIKKTPVYNLSILKTASWTVHLTRLSKKKKKKKKRKKKKRFAYMISSLIIESVLNQLATSLLNELFLPT